MMTLTEPDRLFDCIALHMEGKTIPDMFAAKERGEWRRYSTQEVAGTVDQLSAGLLNLGIGPGDMSEAGRSKVAIISKNRPEWMMLDLAVQRIGAVLTPVYPTISVIELAFILRDAQAKIIFVNDEELFHKVLSIQNQLPELSGIFTFEHVANARHWKEILVKPDEKMLARISEISGAIRGGDLATIIYTSGTTGTPKGVMLSHQNILSNVYSSLRCFPPGELRALSFLPLNHILERMVTYLYLFRGTRVYYAESMDTIAENLREVKPHIFITVPRLLEKVYDRIMQKGNELSGIKRKLFFWAHDLATRYEINKPMGAWYNFQLALANRLVFSKWREGLGNELLCVVSGGAACQVRLIRIFTAARIAIMEGYGLTETSPVISVNRYEVKDRMIGSVGPLIGGVEVKIAEDGEILCKGPNIMIGYYKRPDLTAEVISEGWFHTGDIGRMVDGRFLQITDRKKELFKTSGGKYVAPLPIESKLKESILIEQVLVVGPERKFVGALVVPSFSSLKDWCKQNGIPYTSDEEIIRDARVRSMYKELIDGFNKYFSHTEQVRKFELLPAEWSIETGEMTPKLSLKRKVITEKYRDAIEKIYA
jgi:long-chain acyl-CoA synthetase